MGIKNKFRKMVPTFLSWIMCLATYCGLLIIEGLFYGGDMYVSISTLFTGMGAFLAAFILFFVLKKTDYLSFIVCTIVQLLFIIVGAYLHELSFYFFMMLQLVGIVSLGKSFKILARYCALNIFISLLALIFLVPRLDWVNNYRFFMQFGMFLYGALFTLVQTFNVSRKETRSEQAFSAFSSLLQNTPNYMVITDSIGRVRYISQKMAEFAHFTKQEFAVGQPLLDLFSNKALKLMFADILDADGLVETEMTIKSESGDRHFKVIADKFSDDADGVYDKGLFIDISDITPAIQSKKSAEEAQARAEAANDSKSRFLANMSHEIRTPMNAIIGIAQIYLEREGLPYEFAEALEKIYSSGNSLLGIINDILDMSKIETGKLELIPGEYDVPSLINDAVQLNIVRIGSKPIEFILNVDEKLPSRMFGDELRLKQILNNLLSNAIKYTEEGYVKLNISHIEDGEKIKLRFVVEDTGQGMKPEDKERLFSEYLRFNTESNRTTEGTGLGLSITEQLIDMMDGTIEVASDYGKGSIFTVTVTQNSVKCNAIGAELSERLRNFTFTGDRQHLKQQTDREIMPYGKVLVVDDMETNLYVTEGLLSPYKLKIETAKSGFAAIEKVTNGGDYDIIFMDHMMPQMDGIETTQKLRSSFGYKGVIVALTANALIGNEELFKQNGFDDFISKPIDIRQLNAVLNKFIRDKQHSEVTEPPKQQDSVSLKPARQIDSELLEIFVRDAQKAVVTLNETLANGNIKLFTTTVHAMKSALANVNEHEASEQAFALEKAGLDGDTEFISANAHGFVKTLETLIERSVVSQPSTENNADIVEDKEFLKEQIIIIKNACENYDDTKAYQALDLLKERSWKTETTAALKQIHHSLFMQSDFKSACNYAEKLLLANE